ncbi:MAG: hypothetical protein IJ179_05715 [Oscillospiraceae bacterium]|nr:hypothetical protein [Oscillospiraceae bacterium]
MNQTELLSEVLEAAEAAAPPRKKELFGLPLPAVVILFFLFALLLAACIVNAATIRHLRERSDAMEAQVLQAENAVAMASSLRNGRNRVFLDAGAYTDEACRICVDNDMPLELWTVDDEEQILELNPYITGVTSNRLIAGKVRYEAYTGQN